MSGGLGQHDREDAALTARAADGDVAAVRFEDAARDEQALSQAARIDQLAAVGAGFAPVEALEDVRQVVLGDADAGIDELDGEIGRRRRVTR